MLQLDEIRNLLDPYDATPTECDGMTKICSTILTQQGIKHQPMIGEVTYLNQKIPIHLWIQSGDELIIDYRAKIWLGNSVISRMEFSRFVIILMFNMQEKLSQ